jgi:starch phosphorylase
MSQVESDISWDKHESTVSSIGAEALYNKCLALAHNLWWTWHPDVINLFRDLDPIRWRQLDHNPIALLREFTPERLVSRAAEMVLFSRINHAFRRLKD